MKGVFIISSLLMLLQCINSQGIKFKALADRINAIRRTNKASWRARSTSRFELSEIRVKSLVGKNTSVSKKHPKFKEWSKEEIVKASDKPTAGRRLQSEVLPESLDLRQKFSSCWSFGYVRDQSGCGSCWAVAASSVLSDGYCFKYSKSGFVRQRSFSAQDSLENCPNEICLHEGNGCNGGILNGVFEFAKLNGIVTGENYANFTNCKPYFLPPNQFAESPPVASHECADPTVFRKAYDQDQLKIYDYNFVGGVDLQEKVLNMKQSLNFGFSLLTYFEVYEDFLVYASGVYVVTPDSPLIGGHGLVIVGYGIENGIPYWLCRNTWGVFWGDRGFVKVRQGTDEGKIESLVMEVYL